MIAVGHTSIGVICAVVLEKILPTQMSLFERIVVVLLVSFLSHYLTDFIPHGHYRVKINPKKWWQSKPLMIDLVGFGIFFALLTVLRFGVSDTTILVATGMIGAQLPDVWDWFFVAGGWVKLEGMVLRHRRLHEAVHWHSTTDAAGKRRGLPISWLDIWQVLSFVTAVYLLLRLPL